MTRCNCKFIAQVASGLGRADNAAPCAAANARPLPGPLATVELLGVTTTAGTGSDGGLEGGGAGGGGGGGALPANLRAARRRLAERLGSAARPLLARDPTALAGRLAARFGPATPNGRRRAQLPDGSGCPALSVQSLSIGSASANALHISGRPRFSVS